MGGMFAYNVARISALGAVRCSQHDGHWRRDSRRRNDTPAMHPNDTEAVPEPAPTPSTARLPEISEVLDVRKLNVDTGGYRIEKQVEVHDEVVDELLRDRRVAVERRPIGKTMGADESPAVRYEGDTLVIPVLEEVLVVEKRLVLVEEVRVTRVEGTHRDPQRVRLRKERIVVEPLSVAAATAGAGANEKPEPDGTVGA